MGSINDDHNLIGLSHLMKDDKVNPEINIEELERTIINGEKDIKIEEVDMLNQYKSELARLSSQYGVELSSDDGNLSESIMKDRGINDIDDSWIEQQTSKLNDLSQQNEQSYEYIPPQREHSFSKLQREPSFSKPQRNYNYSEQFNEDNYSYNNFKEGIHSSGMEDYKFQTSNRPSYQSNEQIIDPYARNMTQEQQKRKHLQHMFDNISHNGKVPMQNYDLSSDREYEDKQMLLSAIDDLRDDLQQIGVDISRIKEVDNSCSMAEIREVYNKLIYKNNSNNYSNFADELFLLGAQAAEYMFDGEKEWFGHKPDLTGWSNTVRGKLRRMRYTKTQIVRKIVDDYQIPPWLQIGFEIIPSAFTHSRHRKTAVRGDSVVHNATYQNAIHDLNNIME
jgi:hypothetical protein